MIHGSNKLEHLHLHVIAVSMAAAKIFKIMRSLDAFIDLVKEVCDLCISRYKWFLLESQEAQCLGINHVGPEELDEIIGQGTAVALTGHMQEAERSRDLACLKKLAYDICNMMVANIEKLIHWVAPARYPPLEAELRRYERAERMSKMLSRTRLYQEDSADSRGCGEVRSEGGLPVALQEHRLPLNLKADKALSRFKRLG